MSNEIISLTQILQELTANFIHELHMSSYQNSKNLPRQNQESLTNSAKELTADEHQKTIQQIFEKISVSRPSREEFGDLTTNLPLIMFGFLPQDKKDVYINAFSLAEELAKRLTKTPQNSLFSIFDRVEPKAGFLNFYLKEDFYVQKIKEDFENPESLWQLNQPLLIDKKNHLSSAHLVEYSSPNIAKPFTIGHLRSTIIGQAVANLLELTGTQVYRDNHLGDWGTQFGKMIWAIKNWGDLEKIRQSSQPLRDLVDLYVRFHTEAEDHPQMNDEARAWFKKLEDKDPEAIRLWEFCIDVSREEFNHIYDLLEVNFTENDGQGYGESFFEDKMSAVIDELKSKNLLQASDGAQLVFFPDEKKLPPLMILRQDGATLYATRDLATDKFRLQKYGPDLVIINEVGSEQKLYFEQIFTTEELLGWIKPGQRRHLAHGLYRFSNRKMSTRKGEVIWLEDVLNDIYQEVSKSSVNSDLSSKEIQRISLAALKWNDLSREASRDIIFNLNEITDIKGNSGPYMLYTLVRILGVLKKSLEEHGLVGEKISQILDGSSCSDLESIYNFLSFAHEQLTKWPTAESATSSTLSLAEISLLRKIDDFSDILWRATREYAPYLLANYLYELATKFNAYYAANRLSSQVMRLRLTWLVAQTLYFGLKILGIPLVKKM